MPEAPVLLLVTQSAQRLFGLLDVVQGQFSRLDQARHDGLCAVVEYRQKLIDEPALGRIPRDRGFEDMRIADLLRTPHRLLRFQAVDRGLHGRIRRTNPFRKGLLDFADGQGTAAPQGIHDAQIELAEPWNRHALTLLHMYANLLRYLNERNQSGTRRGGIDEAPFLVAVVHGRDGIGPGVRAGYGHR